MLLRPAIKLWLIRDVIKEEDPSAYDILLAT